MRIQIGEGCTKFLILIAVINKNASEKFMVSRMKINYRNIHWDYESIYIALILGGSSLVIHPYLALFVASIVQIYRKFSSFLFFSVFIPSISMFWAGRNICFEYATGLDDACHYSETFRRVNEIGITNLFDIGLPDFFGNEPGFMLIHHVVWVFSDNFKAFLFLIHVLTLGLLAFGYSKIEKRSAVIMLGLIFFGLGNFAEQAGLHLLKSTLAGAFLFAAIAVYSGNKKLCFALLIISIFIHFSVIPLVSIFFLILIYLKLKKRTYKSIFIIIIFVIGGFLLRIIPFSFLESRYMYIDINRNIYISTFNLLSILSLFFLNFKTNTVILYGITITLILTFVDIVSPEHSFVTGRYFAVIQPFVSVLLFFLIQVLVKGKLLFSIVITLLATNKLHMLYDSSFIKEAFPDFMNLFW